MRWTVWSKRFRKKCLNVILRPLMIWGIYSFSQNVNSGLRTTIVAISAPPRR